MESNVPQYGEKNSLEDYLVEQEKTEKNTYSATRSQSPGMVEEAEKKGRPRHCSKVRFHCRDNRRFHNRFGANFFYGL